MPELIWEVNEKAAVSLQASGKTLIPVG